MSPEDIKPDSGASPAQADLEGGDSRRINSETIANTMISLEEMKAKLWETWHVVESLGLELERDQENEFDAGIIVEVKKMIKLVSELEKKNSEIKKIIKTVMVERDRIGWFISKEMETELKKASDDTTIDVKTVLKTEDNSEAVASIMVALDRLSSSIWVTWRTLESMGMQIEQDGASELDQGPLSEVSKIERLANEMADTNEKIRDVAEAAITERNKIRSLLEGRQEE